MFTFKEVVGKIYKCPHINHFDKFKKIFGGNLKWQ